jgi:hypothetical protein
MCKLIRHRVRFSDGEENAGSHREQEIAETEEYDGGVFLSSASAFAVLSV